MSLLMDIWNSIAAIFTSADLITLGIMAVIVLAAGFVMQGLESIITTTVIALALFGVAGYVKAVAHGGENAAQLAQTQWHQFLGLNMQTVIAYAIAFAVIIGVVSLVRSLVLR